MRNGWWPKPSGRLVVMLTVLASVALLWSSNIAGAQPKPEPDCVIAAYYPPFMNGANAAEAGMSIDVIREAALRAGRDISIEYIPFQRTLVVLQSQQNCLMPALFRNATREKKYRWIATYDAAQLRFITTGDTVNTLEEGRNLNSIVVETGASADQYLTNIGFENLVRVSVPMSSARMLQAGRIDAWVQTQTVGSRLWTELDLHPEIHFGDPIYSVPVYITARLGFPDDIAQAYQDAIREMMFDGTVKEILASYK